MKKIRAALYKVVENIIGRPLTKEERTAIKKIMVIYGDVLKNER